ncbi:prepilin-type N-terminal cleavage/methylation domain-containing protein [Deinococcus sp. 12RED42]|uniref:prepilin-type N-terminal cleavage/methylation domain-containing protein n=1 Tax=Deinococcus sp. 12RED42 TaxID=2745872 RepID=UPI001E565A53|nr:prepilin-type N-terminal cleavage/methylation domain-containing protein [Deinococcus sp. 12RED42]
MKPTAGLTLIEILIALALSLLVLGAAYALTTSTAQANAVLTTRSQLTNEATVASSLLSARLREACAVLPQNTTVTLPDSVKGTKTDTGTTVWRVGTDPFVAFVVPASTVSGSTPMMYAYYLLSRARYNEQMDDAQDIPANSAETSQVLMEFRAPVTAAACTAPLTVAVAPAANAQALLLAEYVRAPTAAEPLFASESDQAVTYRLRFQKASGSSVTVLPVLSQTPIRAAIVGRNIR